MSTIAPERPVSTDDGLEALFAQSVPCEDVFVSENPCPNPAEWKMVRACRCDDTPAYCEPCRKALVEGILPFYEIACDYCGVHFEPTFRPL